MIHWKFENLRNGYANIFCQAITDGISDFKTKREVYIELKEIEAGLKQAGFCGWVAWTYLNNIHIMKLYVKIGAQPYRINLTQETIWFKKELQDVQ